MSVSFFNDCRDYPSIGYFLGWNFVFAYLFVRGLVIGGDYVFVKNIFCGLRITYYYCGMKSEKRNPHTYKCTDKVYSDAMKRAKKEKTLFATLLEEVVGAYADGALTVHFIKPTGTNPALLNLKK